MNFENPENPISGKINRRRQRDHLERRGAAREGIFATVRRKFIPEDPVSNDGAMPPPLESDLLPHEIFNRVLARFSP
jgi:hypothetical protein